MLRVAIAQEEGTHTERVIGAVLEQCAAQLGGVAPQLGILLVSGPFDEAALLDAIERRYPGMPLVGTTIRGSMCSPTGYADDAISLLLLASDTITITAGLGERCAADPQRAVDSAVEQARRGHTTDEVLCLAFPYIGMGEPGDVIRRLDDALAPDCAIFGAGSMAHSSTRPGEELQSTQFFGREVMTDTLPIVLLSGPLEYSFCIENSWTPVGALQTVARSRGRWVERIGERTAVEFYQYYLGQHSRPAREFPIAVFDDDGEHYCLRIPLSYDADSGAVLYSGIIPEGARVQITEAVRGTMLDKTDDSVARAVRGLGDVQPALALVFSCATRQWILGTQTRREAELLSAHAPSVPIFGMYGASEIGPMARGRRCVLHQATLIALILGERQDAAHGDRAWRPALDEARATHAEIRESELLAQRLRRSEMTRADLEETRELNNRLLRTINNEIDESRQMIARQNQELQRLYLELAAEKQKSDELLLEILPRVVADELKERGRVEPVLFDTATVLFADFKGFTCLASELEPRALLQELDYFFTEFDRICDLHGLEKLKTIGDAYMCAGGIPAVRPSHARDVVAAAWDMQDLMARASTERRIGDHGSWQLRVGVNTGPLVAGVIGQRKFAYDIWGETVNIAARMESAGEPGRINISRTTYEAVRDHFDCERRGRIAVKNAGEIEMYFVVDRYS